MQTVSSISSTTANVI